MQDRRERDENIRRAWEEGESLAAIGRRIGLTRERIRQIVHEARKPSKGSGYTVYRFYSNEGELLYVGVTQRGAERFYQHATLKTWWAEVAIARFEHYSTRHEAEHVEAVAIVAEQPVYNIREPAYLGAPRRHILASRVSTEI